MRYLRYICIILTYSVILLIKDLFYIRILNRRHKIREVIYYHHFANKLYIHNLNYFHPNYKRKIEYSRTIYYLYSIQWLFLDDNLNRDTIDTDKLNRLMLDEKIPNVFHNKIRNDIRLNSPNTSIRPFIYFENSKKVDVNFSKTTLFCFISNHNRTNYYYKYFYTRDVNNVFLFRLGDYEFGYVLDNTTQYIVYRLVFFKKGEKEIYGN